MDKLTYRQAYDKIIEAYFKDEIEPFDSEFCFCGTLAPDFDWKYNKGGYPYTNDEYVNMESTLLKVICKTTIGFMKARQFDSNYENALFAGMSAALDVLKEIHRSRGEDVDGEFTPFTKRELVKSL